MTVHDVADLLFSARGRIDFYWNFYVVVVIAVIGWLVSQRRTITRANRALVTLVFLVVAATDIVGLRSSYAIAEALRTDLLRITVETPLTDTRHLLLQHSYLAHRTAALWIHLVVGAAIVIAIWRTRPPQPESTPAKSAREGGEREEAER